MCGGAADTGSVGSEIATSLPYAFVAVTASRSVEPRSAAVGKYTTFVAPAIVWQVAPVASQRCQTNVVAIGRSPLNVPMSAVSWRPIVSVPTIAGAVDDAGEKCCLSTIGNVWFVIATSDPATFVPVIHTRIEEPMSAGRRVRRHRGARDLHAGREVAGRVAAPPRVRERRAAASRPTCPRSASRRVDDVVAEICGVTRSSTRSRSRARSTRSSAPRCPASSSPSPARAAAFRRRLRPACRSSTSRRDVDALPFSGSAASQRFHWYV